MLLDKKPNLTFVKIAAEWAREVAPEPGSLGHNEIFRELVRGLWRGDFEDEEGENTDLTMALSPARQPGGKWVDEHHQRTEEPRKIITITRRELLYHVLSHDRPPGVTLPPRQRLSPLPDPETGGPPVPWSELKTEIPWGALNALTPDEYSPTVRETFLEALTIPKDDFGGWCDEQGHQRPQFWFGKQTDARAWTAEDPEPADSRSSAVRPNRAGRKKGSGSYDSEDAPLVEEMHALIKTMRLWNAALSVADRAPGTGSPESKAKRLVIKYKDKYGLR